MTLDELTYKINGCAMKVHNTLGNGFQEVIYQRCLAIELERAGLGFTREQEHIIYYEDIEVGTRRADFVVEDQVIVELKAKINLEDVHLAQAKNYVVAYNKPIGLLINFGSRSLQFKKIFNPKIKCILIQTNEQATGANIRRTTVCPTENIGLWFGADQRRKRPGCQPQSSVGKAQPNQVHR